MALGIPCREGLRGQAPVQWPRPRQTGHHLHQTACSWPQFDANGCKMLHFGVVVANSGQKTAPKPDFRQFLAIFSCFWPILGVFRGFSCTIAVGGSSLQSASQRLWGPQGAWRKVGKCAGILFSPKSGRFRGKTCRFLTVPHRCATHAA